MDPLRTEKEFSFLDDPATPQLLWIAGNPVLTDTWQASTAPFEGASQQWVGPGFTPLQFRARFNDSIHLGTLGNQLIGERVSEILVEKGW
jgi:lysophospholipase L1-like esterase